MYAFNLFILDAAIFLAFSLFYMVLAFFSSEFSSILYLISWIVGPFLYPILLKGVLLEENSSYLKMPCKVIILILLPFTLAFWAFALRTDAFKHHDWESMIFFKHYVLVAIPLIIISFIMGKLVAKFAPGLRVKDGG